MSKKQYHRKYEPLPDELNVLGKEIVDAAFKVHKSLGPGLLEEINALAI